MSAEDRSADDFACFVTQDCGFRLGRSELLPPVGSMSVVVAGVLGEYVA